MTHIYTTRSKDVATSIKRKLTKREVAFVEYYLQHNVAAKAARLAGYLDSSSHTQGYRLLQDPAVQAAITTRASQIAISTDEVLNRLKRHSRADIADICVIRTEEFPEYSEYSKYISGSRVSFAGRCYRAVDKCEGVSPAEDGLKLYWEEFEPRRWAEPDLLKAIETGNSDLIKSLRYDKWGKPVISMVDSQAATVYLDKILNMRNEESSGNGDTINITINNLTQSESERQHNQWVQQQKELIHLQAMEPPKQLTQKP